MLAGALGAVAFFLPLILGIGTGGSAGFGMKEFTWYQYLFTQFRGIWVYIGNFLLPVNLNLDWDFAISRTILDKGAIFGLIGLAGLAAAAWLLRRRFRLAAYGYFLFLLLLAPTSSILPIKDPVADRRIYLPMIGLLLIVMDFAAPLEDRAQGAGGGLRGGSGAGGGAVTYARAGVWGDPVSLWEDTVRKSPGKSRTHFQLGFAYYQEQRYDLAVPEFEKAVALSPPDYDLLIDFGLAYDGLHQYQRALEKLQQAAAIEPPRTSIHRSARSTRSRAAGRKRWTPSTGRRRSIRNSRRFTPTKGWCTWLPETRRDRSRYSSRRWQSTRQFQPARDGMQQAEQRLRAPR